MITEGKHVIINEARALEVFTILCNEWKDREKSWLFKDIVLPENQYTRWVRKLDLETQARWYFVTSLFQRARVMAEDVFIPAWVLFQHPEHQRLFHPEHAASIMPKNIVDAIQEVGPLVGSLPAIGEKKSHALGHQLEGHVKAWLHNMRVIVDHFDGQVMNLFSGSEAIPIAEKFEFFFSRIDKKDVSSRKLGRWLMGMRRKIFSLFVIFLQKDDLIPQFPCPIPVDFHALRLLTVTGVVTFKGTKVLTGEPVSKTMKLVAPLFGKEIKRYNEGVVDEIAIWINPFLQRHKLKHLHLNPALWVLSRELCAAHPQNTVYKKGQVYLFPEVLEAGVSQLGIRLKKSLCSYCPVEHRCDYAMPARPHQNAGCMILIPRDKTLPSKGDQGTLWHHSELYDFRGNKYNRSKKKGPESFEPRNRSDVRCLTEAEQESTTDS